MERMSALAMDRGARITDLWAAPINARDTPR